MGRFRTWSLEGSSAYSCESEWNKLARVWYKMPVSLMRYVHVAVLLTGDRHSCSCKLFEYGVLGVITLTKEKVEGMFPGNIPMITSLLIVCQDTMQHDFVAYHGF